MSTDTTVKLVCESCGSSSVKMTSDRTGICESCGTKFYIRRDEGHKTVIVHPMGEKQADIVFMHLASTRTPESFLRGALLRLFSDKNSPFDLKTENFSAVRTDYLQFGLVTADYKLNYTVNIGVKRIEQYTDYITRSENGRSYRQPVVRERTVTDWHPMSGDYARDDTLSACLLNAGETGKEFNERELCKAILDGLSDAQIDKENNMTDELLLPAKSDVKRAEDAGASIVSGLCRAGLPGDTVADFRYTYSASVKSVNWLGAEHYTMPYSYCGKEYEVRGFACARDLRLPSMPKHDVQAEITAENKEQKKKELLYPMLGIGAVYLLMVIIDVIAKTSLTSRFSFLCVISAIAYLVFHFRRWHKITKQKTEERTAVYMERKLTALSGILSTFGLDPLSDMEKSLFKL